MLIHWIWLSCKNTISLQQRGLILQHFSDAEEVYNAPEASLKALEWMTEGTAQALADKDLSRAEAVARVCRQLYINIVTYRDAAYPSRLRSITDPPAVLYYRGVLPDLENQPVIAVVGTRKATTYGLRAAKNISAQMACCGALVISGGAFGVDAAAMEMALNTGNPTIAVLGCGVDILYPAGNRSLLERTIENGCVMSEYPPGTRPERWHFPERNRILSGLSHGVLVVEAPQKSGALITARDAMEQGRDVFAVPGNIDSQTCEGSNALLRDGGFPAMTGWDVLRQYEGRFSCVQKREVTFSDTPQPAQRQPQKETGKPVADKKVIDKEEKRAYSGILDLTAQEQKVMQYLGTEPVSVDWLISQLNEPPASVLRTLTMLSVKGVVIQHPGRSVSANVK